MRPSSTTSTRSAISTVDSRCAMISAVRSAQHGAQRPLNRSFGRHVERRRRLVENQHGRVGEERPRERDELALPGGQPPASLAHVGVVAGGQPLDELVRPDGAGGRFDFLRGGAGATERDVVGDRSGEQEAVLGHHDDCLAQVDLGNLREGRHRPGARSRPSGRRSARSAWRSSTCRLRSRRPAPRSARPVRAGRTRAAPGGPAGSRTRPGRGPATRAAVETGASAAPAPAPRAARPARLRSSPTRRSRTAASCRRPPTSSIGS